LTETIAPQPVSPVSSQRHRWYSPEPEAGAPEPAPEPAPAPTPTGKPPSEPLSKHATHLYTISYLIFFSFLGTLARLGLQALTFYTGAPVVTGVLWANLTGSLVMGFLLEDKNLFQQEWGTPTPTPKDAHEAAQHATNHRAVKKTIPLYIGLTTGFCGCCTSFSSFMRDVFLALANALPDPSLPAGTGIASRNGGYSFMALVAVLILTISLSLSALIFGAHLALALARVTPTVPFALTRRVLDRVMVFLAWGCWLGAVFLAIWPPDRHGDADTWRGRAVFALVFAPLGCLGRFYISVLLNSRIPSFPLGTFAVNMLGTAVLGLCYDLQHVSGLGAVVPAALTGCGVLQGVMDGFCGSLTTISTWVAELNGVARRSHAYIYGVVSVAGGLGLLVVIMGSLLWTRGFEEPVCG
jgi:fluoride ion exporter CrcB/FEX